MRIIHGEAVFEELVNLSFFIAQDNEDAAQRFLAACDETFAFLANNKNVGATRTFQDPTLRDVRMWRVKGFEKYLIFYQPLSDGIKILHVIHSARNYDLLFES
jgi:toxin ParE1/3/4